MKSNSIDSIPAKTSRTSDTNKQKEIAIHS